MYAYLLLLDCSHVPFADAVSVLGKLESAFIVREILLKNPLAPCKIFTGSQSVLYIAERAQCHLAVLGHRLPLFHGADGNLSVQGSALINRCGKAGAGPK